jgi:hypothetical protein
MDVETPSRGRHIPEACTGERGGRSARDSLAGLDPGGSYLPTMTLACLGVFWHFLGEKSSTRAFARLFLVNVSEIMQFFFPLNGYSIFTFHLLRS